jgi:hypothetical protein
MGKINMRRQAIAFITFALIFLVFVAFAIAFGHAAITGKNRANSLGVTEVYTNPNIYLFGVLTDGAILAGDHDDLYTNVRIQPYATMSLYDESILLCGNEAGSFKGKHGPLLLTYHRIASRAFKGIACHDLISVFEVPSPKE